MQARRAAILEQKAEHQPCAAIEHGGCLAALYYTFVTVRLSAIGITCPEPSASVPRESEELP
jgi:hypothetical protein